MPCSSNYPDLKSGYTVESFKPIISVTPLVFKKQPINLQPSSSEAPTKKSSLSAGVV